MRLINYIIILFLFAQCSTETPENLVGVWRVDGFRHSINEFNDSEKKELEKRARSTTYEFKQDFSLRVTSGFTKKSKTGTWYWDPYREKLVINNNTVFSENVDTIFIYHMDKNEMSWMQTFSNQDTSYVHLKRVE